MNTTNNWFESIHSNVELQDILYNYSRDVNGEPLVLNRAGRCTLTRHLEALDQQVAMMPRHRLAELGWL